MTLAVYDALVKATAAQTALQESVRAHAKLLASQAQPTSSTEQPHSSPSQRPSE